MKSMTNSAWAAVFIFFACVLATVSLFSHSSNSTSVITIASSIITGAFGYIQGKKDGQDSVADMPPNSSVSSTTTVGTTTPDEKP